MKGTHDFNKKFDEGADILKHLDRKRYRIPGDQLIDHMQNLMSRKVASVVFILFLSFLSKAASGQDQQEQPRINAIAGYNVEVSATNDRDIVNVGLWFAEPGLLMHVGLYDIKPKDESGAYGADIGMGYCLTNYRLWPFAEIGVKVGVGAGVTNLNAELYPKIGVSMPITDQMLVYIGYLYSFSTQGRHSDYSAASVGFVWAIM
jgi:hypothetical protein